MTDDKEICSMCQGDIAPGRHILVAGKKTHLTCWLKEYLRRTGRGEETGSDDSSRPDVGR
jgi:hypothetical protein